MAGSANANQCGCDAGTFENGWHETRSAECGRKERQAFAAAVSSFYLEHPDLRGLAE